MIRAWLSGQFPRRQESFSLSVEFPEYDVCFNDDFDPEYGSSLIEGIGTPVRAALDRNFREELPLLESSINDDGIYIFQFGCENLPSKIYLAPPSLLVVQRFEASEAVAFALNSEDRTIYEKDSPFFEITSIESTRISAGVFQIDIHIVPAPNRYPWDVSLILGDTSLPQIFGGTVAYSFDSTSGFEPNTLGFRYNTGARDQIDSLLDDAVLIIGGMVLNVDNPEMVITSDVAIEMTEEGCR